MKYFVQLLVPDKRHEIDSSSSTIHTNQYCYKRLLTYQHYRVTAKDVMTQLIAIKYWSIRISTRTSNRKCACGFYIADYENGTDSENVIEDNQNNDAFEIEPVKNVHQVLIQKINSRNVSDVSVTDEKCWSRLRL